MALIEPLGLSAKSWQFLSAPDKYVKASERSDRQLVSESTRRQFLTARDILARLNGSRGKRACKGILLADDVGLGKTTVAALVAWVVASAGGKHGVRVLAPNDVMMRRWVEELQSHVELLQERAPGLKVQASRVKVGRVRRLSPGSIQVVKHSYAASGDILNCDLLIVDEAHRAKGESAQFSKELKRQKKHSKRVLILTATPFSIHLDELERMLTLIGGDDDAKKKVKDYSQALDKLYSKNRAANIQVMAKRLTEAAENAVNALSRFVIRHSVDNLPAEESSFGVGRDWPIEVPPANGEELELMIRMDRALRVAKHVGSESSKATNDPRFHVGWQHFDQERARLQAETPRFGEPAKAVIDNHLRCIQHLRGDGITHSKMAAVGKVVKSLVDDGEKVVLFCHHIATAQELTLHLGSILTKATTAASPKPSLWKQAWDEVLGAADEERDEDEDLRDTFIDWLCSDLIRAQTWGWLPEDATSAGLADALRETKGRNAKNPETIDKAARRLYHAFLHSKSSKAVLKAAGDCLGFLPGANGASRVLGVCTAIHGKEALFLGEQQPDTIISVFNSPFGPDVLVVTDKLSEGIDLHRYCRCLIHYELDPSPIRTVQRNGRLRRVNSWAAVTEQRILYAYPAFRGTRDEKLVQIMKKRIDSFSLLLGGVQDFDVEEVVGSEENWRNDVIASAKNQLKATGGRLRAREPGAHRP